MNEPLVITRTSTRGRAVVLHVQGRLDARNADLLRQRGAEVAAEGRNLVLNLNAVTFMGSGGLGALMALSEEFQEQAGQVRIVELSVAARAAVELVSLDQILSVDTDEESALEALKAA